MVPSDPLKIVCVVGPTASGKSDLALRLAQKFSGEIVNADSRQFYRELQIGTAKPSVSEQALVPHHLIDCATLPDPWNVARFVQAAHAAIAKISSRGHLPVVVGGTGLYLKALLFGVDAIPPIDPAHRLAIQNEYHAQGLPWLYQKLQSLDPVAAARLKPNDTQRILRALEVVIQTGQPLHSFWSDEASPSYNALRLAIDWPRPVLYARIDERVDRMLVQGLKAEAQALWQSFPENLVLAKTIGYREWAEQGFADDARVLSAIQQNTRHFAKRQMTWFRKEKDIVWYSPDQTKDLLDRVAMFTASRQTFV